MRSRAWLVVVAVLSVAAVAVGLRVGAGDAMLAAVVYGSPLPRGGGALAWQLHVESLDGHTHTPVLTRFTAIAQARGQSRTVTGTTNEDGTAELRFELPVVYGDPIDLEVLDERGLVLARGAVTWPPQTGERGDTRTLVRASRNEGALRMSVAVLGARLAPGEAGRVWIKVDADGQPPRDVRIDATTDPGVEIERPYTAGDATCPKWGVMEVMARGHIGGVLLHAHDGLGREGEWYGAMPIAAGAMHVRAPLVIRPGPLHVDVTSASARTIAYAELDDAMGRVAAEALALTGEPPTRGVDFVATTPGLSWLVVSGEPDGAAATQDATRALPLWVGDGAPCESDLAGRAPPGFMRFVALDGFVARKAVLAHRRKRGRFIALGALALGSLLETLLLLRAASEGRRGLARLADALEGESAPRPARRGVLDLLVVLLLSGLGFMLLFALVEWQSR